MAYNIVNQWGNGFQADVTITNNGSSLISGWNLTWTFGPGQQFDSGWNATFNPSGSAMSASNVASHWNGTIEANGGTVAFGFQGTHSGTVTVPTDFAVNGTPCDGSVAPTPTTVPPTATTAPPTATTVPPTATTVPPTATSQPPTATAAPPTPTTVPPTATPGGNASCTVAYDIVNQWGDGFQANVTITNLAGTAVQGYTLAWNFGAGEQFSSGWNATYSQTGTSMNASNVASHWNGTIGANGGSVSFGFVANHTGTVSSPANFTLNGTSCSN